MTDPAEQALRTNTARKRMERLAWVLDDVIRVPGTRWRFGLDSLLGLFPGLGDVAGMLRSLDYAAATSDQAAGPGSAEAAPLAAMREAFLEGYHAQADQRGGRFLPPGAGIRDAWTGLFELEKALYEVEYELNNRPTWVHIPLAALARLLTAPR